MALTSGWVAGADLRHDICSVLAATRIEDKRYDFH